MGGGNYADIIATHGYVNTSPETLDGVLGKMRDTMNANGQSGKQLWDTEASFSLSGNCSICDPDQQAAFLVRHYMIHLSRGVDRYLWYSWDDAWGTLWTSASGVLKPGIAYKNVYNWLVGATFSQPCSISNGIWTCGITRPNGYQGIVVWNPTASVSYTAASQYKQYRDIYGNTVTMPSNGVITVNNMPLLLETGTTAAGQSAPSALLNVNPQSGTAPVTVTADSSASSDSDGTIVSRSINFGDGYIASNVATASHAFAAAGTYNVTLSVTDNSGLTTKSAKAVTVTAPACNSSVSVGIASPTAGYTLPNPLNLSATATSGCKITKTTVMVDGATITSVASGAVSVPLSLATGNHNVTVQAWNETGATSSSSVNVGAVNVGACAISTANRTITTCYPLANTTVPQALRVVAGATGTNGVKAMRIYVDNQSVYLMNSGRIDTTINLSPGIHYLVVQAWDNGGAVFKSGRNITVK